MLFVKSREGERNGVVGKPQPQKTRKQITMESARKEKSDNKGGPHVIEVDDEDDLKLVSVLLINIEGIIP